MAAHRAGEQAYAGSPAGADDHQGYAGDPSDAAAAPEDAATSPHLAVQHSAAVRLAEVTVVLGLAVGVTAARSVLDLIQTVLTAPRLSAATATLNATQAPQHPWLDLGFQLVFIASLLLPVGLVAVLLARDREPAANVGVRFDRWGKDVLIGLGAAALVGGIGLAAYLISNANGASLTIVPTNLPAVWWRIPVLVLSACANAALEETVLVGYLLSRLRRLGLPDWLALSVSATVRGAYHLYQGLAGALGNLVMGAFFGRYFQRTGRVLPQFVAHASIDIVAFVGYVLLAGHVSWLPT